MLLKREILRSFLTGIVSCKLKTDMEKGNGGFLLSLSQNVAVWPAMLRQIKNQLHQEVYNIKVFVHLTFLSLPHINDISKLPKKIFYW